MSNSEIHVEILQNEIPFFHHSFIFNTKKYFDFHSISKYVCFILRYENDIKGLVIFSISNNKASSPFRATFGGFDFLINQECNSNLLFQLYLTVINYFKSKNIHSISITLSPCYLSNMIRVEKEVLLNVGFTLLYEDTNYHININQTSFYQNINKAQQWRIRRINKMNPVVSISSCIKKVYEPIVNARKRKKYPVSMTENELQSLHTSFPEAVKMWTLELNSKLAASAVTVDLGKNTLYTFYVGDQEEFYNLSPILKLHESIYEYAQNNGYKFLDLGISSFKGEINDGLSEFKKNNGASCSSKSTFEYIY